MGVEIATIQAYYQRDVTTGLSNPCVFAEVREKAIWCFFGWVLREVREVSDAA